MLIWYTIIAVTAVVCGGLIFVCSKELRRFNSFMGFTLIFEGLAVMLAGIMFCMLDIYYLPIYLLYMVMLLSAPFLYYLASRFLLKESGGQRKDLWMLTVVLVFVCLYLPVVMCIEPSERTGFFRIMKGLPYNAGTGANVLLALDSTAYLIFFAEQTFVQIFCCINVAKYQKHLESYYSSLEGRSFGQVKGVLALMALRFLVFCVFCFAPNASGAFWFNILTAVVFLVFYIVVTLLVCKVRYSAEELGRLVTMQESKSQPPAANDIIESKLASLIDERFFLNPDVNLMDIATRIHVNSKYISEFLKYHYGETFLAYVNRLRVEHAVTLMSKGTMAEEDIASQSGFTNTSTFYRNFIKVKGYSPSKYRKNL